MNNEIDERMLELLCDQALFGLSEDELRELARFEQTEASRDAALQLELTAARLSTAGVMKGTELPEHLLAKVTAESKNHIKPEETIYTAARRTPVAESSSTGMFGWLGWAVAAAACVALAVTLFNRPEAPLVAGGGPTPSPTVSELSPAAKRERLIASGQRIVRAEWGKGNVAQAGEISGDVVWSDDQQTGYMRITGLPANDRNREQYQLWISEDAKLEPHPKDGGVFDVNADGEVIIPIDAKLRTIDPKAFAITIERPGGTVVSTREKIAGLAAVKPSQS